jgi:hypothetical protein
VTKLPALTVLLNSNTILKDIGSIFLLPEFSDRNKHKFFQQSFCF